MACLTEMKGITSFLKDILVVVDLNIIKLRSSMVGADLNRVWNDYSEYFHPTVKAAMDAIRHLDDQPVRLC